MELSLHRRLANKGGQRHPVDFSILERRKTSCEPADPANTVTDRLNNLLQNGGEGYTLHLCRNQRYIILAPVRFTNNNQEISTLGYPTTNERAVLVINGPVSFGQGHTTAVDGTCASCSGVKLRNIQVDGTRNGASPTNGGGNIEMGGDNQNQLIEYVRSYSPRSWTCLHIAEGSLACNGVTIQNNDIGPCGSDTFQEWADGISLSCRNSIVRNNMIQGATDGGIVIFGSPGSQIYNNTIWVLNQTLLGGINMVDYNPWNGDFTGTIVRDNVILGGFATDDHNSTESKGSNVQNAIIKIGIAIGPRSWFGNKFGDVVVRNGIAMNNNLTGAFSYGVAVTSAANFTVQGILITGNTSFIGARGPNCSTFDSVPNPGPFLVEQATTQSLTLQGEFQQMSDGESLTCVLPPNGGDFWPYGLNPSNSSSTESESAGSSGSSTTGIALGVVFGILACAVASWFIRKWYISRTEAKQLYNSTKIETHMQQI